MAKKKLTSHEEETHCDNGLYPICPDKMETMSKEVKEHFHKPENERVYSELLETICGGRDDSQPVEQYDGTLGVNIPFVTAHERPVGMIQWNDNLSSIYTNPGNTSGANFCTGTLVSNNLFLTAGHCFDQTGGGWIRPKDNMTGTTIPSSEIATNMHIQFNRQDDPSGNPRAEQSFPILELVEYRLEGLDFAIVRLGGNPGGTFGVTQVSTTDANVGNMLCIIGHPAGVPKRIEAGPTTDLHGARIGYNDIDTLGGSSGAGILRASDGHIVGIHTNGGCSGSGPGPDNSHNHGVRITSIIESSPTLRRITTPTFKHPRDDILKHPEDDILKNPDTDRLKRPIDDITSPRGNDFIGTFPGRLWGDQQTHPWTDNPGTSPWKDNNFTTPRNGDVKLGAYDKPPFSDNRIPDRFGNLKIPGDQFRQPNSRFTNTKRPFILATPHHIRTNEAECQTQYSTGNEQIVEQYEVALMQLEQEMQENTNMLEQLQQQYEEIIAEYQSLLYGQ